MAWLVAAAFLFVFAWAVAGNSLSFDSASLDSWCGHTSSEAGDVQAETCTNPCAHSSADVAVETFCNDYCPSGSAVSAEHTRDCNPCDGIAAATGTCNGCPETGNDDCNPCAGVTAEHNTNPTPSPKDCETPTPPVETPTPVVDCAKQSRVDLLDPSVPDSSDEYDYGVDACGVQYVKFMGCWEKDDVDHVETSAGTVEIFDDGKIRINGLTDGDFPLDVTIFFTTAFPSGAGSVNTWLFKGPADSDGDSIWVDGPICIPVTETPTPPTETPSPPTDTPTNPPKETPSPPTETPTNPPTDTPTTPPTQTPTDTPTPTVDCAKTSSAELESPTVPNTSDTFEYEVDGCGIQYVKFMGCWEKDDIDHVDTSAGTVQILDDGKIRINGLTDGDFPLNVTIVFKSAFPSGSGTVNAWLFQGPRDSDGDSIWIDGPVCVPVTETPTPPVETPTPTPPTDTPAPPTETPTTPPPPETDLTIVKTDQPDPVQPRGTLSYSITVNNISDVDAENVVMTDALPAGVTLISATPSQGTCTGATCNLGTILAHQAAAISVVVTLDTGAPALLTNVACVATSTSETNLSNNCDDEETRVPTPTPPGATSTPKAPSNLPNSGGIPGASSASGQSAIAFAAALALFGLAAGFVARRRTDQA